MDISKVEDFLALTISKEVLKDSLGDGPEFELVYEAFLNDKIENINSTSENSKENTFGTSSYGERLEDIPLRIRNNFMESEKSELEIISDIDNNYGVNNYNLYYSQNESVDMDKIYETVDKYTDKYGVDKNLVLAIINQESNFNPNAVSSAGAKGLMQLMDFNSEAYGVKNPFDIEENINAGVKHIKSYLDMYDGNIEMALMAYNAGPGTVSRRGVTSESDLYKMPEETQNYVPKIMTQLGTMNDE